MDRHLESGHVGIKRAILDKIKHDGLAPQEFMVQGLPAHEAWTF
jgi:hypothetical protein